MSPEDLLIAYLRWLPQDPHISAAEEAVLCRRIAFELIRMRLAISRCELVQRAAIQIARQVLSGSPQTEYVVPGDPLAIRRHFEDIVKAAGEPARLSKVIRRIPFRESQWRKFTERIVAAADLSAADSSDATSLWRTLHQILRGRHEAETAAHRLVRANLRVAAAYATQYLDYGLDFPEMLRATKLGMMRAAHTFDYRRNRRFFSYAKAFIGPAIRNASARLNLPAEVVVEPPPNSHWVN